MLVNDRMSKPVVFVEPSMRAQDAMELMRKENIRRMPVVDGGKLVGIVSATDLLNAAPSQATSLSIWELNYLLSKIKVADVMTSKVVSVNEDTAIEEAARIMADNKIGGLPVMRNGNVVGIITETDLFRIFLEMFGARIEGVRATILLEDIPGTMAKVVNVIAENSGNIVAAGTFSGDDQASREVVLKITGLDLIKIQELISPFVLKIKDIRACC